MGASREALLARFRQGSTRPALTVQSGTYSYRTLGALALGTTHAVRRACGDAPGLRVAILASGTLTAYVALLAAWELDAVYIPLDPSAPADRLRDMLRRSAADVVIVDQTHLARLPELAADLPAFEPMDARWWGAATVVGSRAAQHADRRDTPPPRYVLFTSGSTGVPKGIGIPETCLEVLLTSTAELIEVRQSDVVAQSFDFTFDLAQYSVLATWRAGAHLVVMAPSDRLQPVQFVQRHQISYWFSVPSVARIASERHELEVGVMPTVRISLFCGEALPLQLGHAWREATGGHQVWNLYGPTEATIACSAHQLVADETDDATGTAPLGRPLRGTQFAVLGADGQAHEVAEDSSARQGELLIGGSQLFGGYLGDEDRSRAAFLNGRDGRRWYRSGDRVRVTKEGAMVYLGRLDEQVQVRGYRVEPREVEHRIASALSLRPDQVVVLPVTRADGTVSDLSAYITGADVDEDVLRNVVGEALPRHMTPSELRQVATFPLNGNGKIDRAQLLRLRADEAARSSRDAGV